ncbi:MAG TPA: hypothetical protein VL832_20165 [Puia sp.]|nr:hypothetical protein [Puia sp.]
MSIRQRWLDSASYRFFLTMTGFRKNNDHKEYEFVPYFQYKIGPYERDYTLYFAKKPSKLIYHREIFAKMVEYYGYGLIGYLDYHYKAYTDKKEFLRFLRYEILERSKYAVTPIKSALEQVLNWVREEEDANNRLSGASQHPEVTSPEPALNSLAGPFPGRMQLNNQLNTEKYTQLLILAQGLTSPGRDGEYLFKRCSDSDLAAILHHFEHLGGLRLNTLQKKVAEARKHLDLNDPKVEKLNQALLEFFYH